MREGWEIRKLGDFSSIKSGKAIDASEISSTQSNGLFPCFGGNGIRGYVKQTIGYGVMPIIGRVGALCGNVQITNGHFYATEHALVVNIKDASIYPHWYKYALTSMNLRQYAKGVAQPVLAARELEKLSIPVPSIAEQEKIVAELDCLTGIIEKKKQQLEELDKLAQAIFYDMFGDPITNEKGWEVKEISSLFDVGSSKRVFEAQWRDNGVPFYRAREIVRLAKGEPIEDPIFVEEALYKEYSVKYGVPRPNDMMITGVGTLGVCYIVKADDRFYFKDGNILWFKQKGLCETRFIKEQYATDYVMNQIKGNANIVTVGTYTITIANKTKVIVPPLELQKQFVNRLEAIDRQKELVKQSIVETETLFNSRMDYWFN